jgi:hypothetical protein
MLTEKSGDINEICIIPWAEGSRNRTEKNAYESGTSASCSANNLQLYSAQLLGSSLKRIVKYAIITDF